MDESPVYIVVQRGEVLAAYHSLQTAQNRHGWGWKQLRPGVWRWSNYDGHPEMAAYIYERRIM